jgi:hypothetical protein
MTTRTYWIVAVVSFAVLSLAKGLYDRAIETTCWAGGYKQDAWMAYCNSERFGVYDTEAIWNGTEAEAQREIRRAKVLTLSDSHLQNALSLGGASEWFAQRNLPFYMLGVPHNESGFGERLLERLRPHPDVLILDASPYFTGDVGKFERGIFEDPQASRAGVLELKGFQSWHQRFCDELPAACGHNFSYFRSRRDGHWIFPPQTGSIWIGWHDVPNDAQRFPTATLPNAEYVPLYPKYLQFARRMLALTDVPRDCIVITNVPAMYDLSGLARYLGDSLGLTVVTPQVPGLSTFDKSHLTPQSSVRWTRAFLEDLEPVISRCVRGHYPAAVANTPGDSEHAHR